MLRSGTCTKHETFLEPEEQLAATAAVMSDASRARMLCSLMDGRAWTATELGAAADISASTASAHLARLMEQRFITCLMQGRHRYYRLASPAIAELLEKLMDISWAGLPVPKITTPVNLRYARTCYDHMAGEIAVEIYDRLITKQWLANDGTLLTMQGKQAFATIGIAIDSPSSRRKFCCPCLDWSERRYHLGGAVGAAMLLHFIQQRWIEPVTGYRELRITKAGHHAFKCHFDIAN